MVEKGGDKLVDTLGRNDPWGSDHSCPDSQCVPCGSRRWIQEQKKAAKALGQRLPDDLLTVSSNQCRREGCNYTLQCLGCLDLGHKALYRGESARSCRQRQREHLQDLKGGKVASPLVMHTVEVHGGVVPRFLAVLDQVEDRAMYRLIRESIRIQDQDPESKYNLNRCQEWGSSSVLPEVQVTGGSRWSMDVVPEENPRPDWTREMKRKIDQGVLKRVELVHMDTDPVQPEKKKKRLRRDSTSSVVSLGQSDSGPDESGPDDREATSDVEPTDQPVPAPVVLAKSGLEAQHLLGAGDDQVGDEMDQGGFVAVPVPAPPNVDELSECDMPEDPAVCPASDSDEMEGRQGVVEDCLEALGGTSVAHYPVYPPPTSGPRYGSLDIRERSATRARQGGRGGGTRRAWSARGRTGGPGMAGVVTAGLPRPLTGPGSRGPRRPGSRRLTPSAARSQARAMGAWLGTRAGTMGTASQERVGGPRQQPPAGQGGTVSATDGAGSGEYVVAGVRIQSDQAPPRMSREPARSPGTRGSPGTQGRAGRNRRRRGDRGVRCVVSRDSPGWLGTEEEEGT